MMALLTRPRTWIITAVVVVVVAGAAVWWFGFAHKTDADAAPATSTTLTVSTQTLEQSVSGTGTLSPTVDQQVDFAASGTVTAVNVQAGQTVKAGDVLATITTQQAEADLAEAQATLASDQAKLSSDQSSSDGSSADAAQVTADQAAVSVAQTSVTSAQNEVNGTTLTAPVAGLVTAVNVAVGDSVSGGSSSGASGSGSSSTASGSSSTRSSSSATSSASSGSGSSSSSGAFEITGTDSWTTQISVAAAQVKNLKTGDQVTLSTTENPSFFGTVSSIGLLPSTSSGAATYPVDVQVTGTPQNLYDGVSVTADVIYKKVTDAVAVPSLAVTQSNGKSTVTKLVSGKQVQQTVTTGIQQGQYIQITDGLKSGDKIVLKIARRVTSGTGTTGTNGTRGGSGTGGFGGSGFGGSGFGGGTGGFGGRGFGGGTGSGGTGTTGSFQRPSGAGN